MPHQKMLVEIDCQKPEQAKIRSKKRYMPGIWKGKKQVRKIDIQTAIDLYLPIDDEEVPF